METLRLQSTANGNPVCNALLTYQIGETGLGTEYATLQDVTLEPTSYSTQTISIDLCDDTVREHYQELLSLNLSIGVFDSLEKAENDEKKWHEAYESQHDLFINGEVTA